MHNNFVVFVPDLQVACTKEIFIIGLKFFQTGPCDICEFYLCFLRGCRGEAPFDNVLFPTTRCLHHLTYGSVEGIEEPVCEVHGTIVDDFGFLVAEKIAITTIRWDKPCGLIGLFSHKNCS